MFNAGDPQASYHFVRGFYEIEENSWRWTAKTFSVSLVPPLHSAQNGAQLVVHLAVPEVIIQNLKSTKLTASIQALSLGSQTYHIPGPYTYLRDVPGNRLRGDEVRVDFAVDQALPPGNPDLRELGIVVADVGLVAK
jgi:hypothetical protein